MAIYSPAAAYRILLRKFGPQGWWPVTPRGGSRPEYHPGRPERPGERQAVEIALGAILTQNTAWTNVERAIANLHRARAVDAKEILAMPRGRLERLVRPSGYFRQKARRLKDFLGHVRARGGKLTAWLAASLDETREDLLAVRGIGPETADSILLYAAGRPAFVVDAYTLRIGGRLGWFGARRRAASMRGRPKGVGYDEARDYLTRRLPRSVEVYREFHALLVALAKYHCRPDPLCGACPLREGCRHGISRAN